MTDRSFGFVEDSVPRGYERFLEAQLFEPWARDLVGRAALRAGSSAIDIACGLGTVARLAARALGADGRVVAIDISPAMLALGAARPVETPAAPIEYLEFHAQQIGLASDSFDAAFCQQGLHFFPDRVAALREMRRLVRPGSPVLCSSWSAEHALGFLGVLIDALRESSLPEPGPAMYDHASYVLAASTLAASFREAGFEEVEIETARLVVAWPSIEEAAAAVFGTPFGPAVAQLDTHERAELLGAIGERLRAASADTSFETFANVARAVA